VRYREMSSDIINNGGDEDEDKENLKEKRHYVQMQGFMLR
jgi:hypothetical protein